MGNGEIYVCYRARVTVNVTTKSDAESLSLRTMWVYNAQKKKRKKEGILWFKSSQISGK